MKPENYIKSALRTDRRNYREEDLGQISPRLEHAVYGLVTEAGELLDHLKRVRFYREKIDQNRLIGEAGDLMWYLALLCDELKVDFPGIWRQNIQKLRVRFPKGFSELGALERNIEKEKRL